MRINAKFKTGKFPDRNTEYFLYQTLIGAWPIEPERLREYIEKAAREAKQQTSWTQQNKEFEDALWKFTEDILASNEFIADVESFLELVIAPGRINGLAQTLLRYTAPGVPDTYQGSELWDQRLVDPDNRGPVDYEVRRAMIRALEAGLSPEEIMRRIDTGLPKLWIAHRTLHLRVHHPKWFGKDAAYGPLYAEGTKKEHVIAYLRGEKVITIVPRWNLKLGASWSSTSLEIPAGRWKNILTGNFINGGRARLQTLLEHFPVALLIREQE